MADMVPHKIEPAESAGGAMHDRADEIVLLQIADEPQRSATGGGDFADDRSTPAWSMSTTPTAAPSRAKRKAPARPIPDAAALTMPILPSSRMVFLPSRNRASRRAYAAIPFPS